MAEYITKGIVNDIVTKAATKHDALTMINGIPAADVRPVVHGTWKLHHVASGNLQFITEVWWCSACHLVVTTEGYAFCPHCGADMRERRQDDKQTEIH